MAFVLTYNTLTQAIKDYLERNDSRLVDSIPLFIMLGQRRIAVDLKILGLKITVSDSMVQGESIIAKPVRWQNDASFSIGIGGGQNTFLQLKQRSYEWCRKYWDNPNATGQPKYYSSDYNYNFWFIVPTPDANYNYQSIYYQEPEFIDENISTNFLTENIPQALLYSTLYETAVYLKDDERAPVWKNYYEEAKASLSQEDLKRIFDSFSKRDM